ncbi:MAG: hypothetical protein WBG37_01585 [Desulfobacterales bacterium]
MTRKVKIIYLLVICGLILTGTAWADSAHRLGAGLHYWTALDDIDLDEVDEDGFGLIIS